MISIAGATGNVGRGRASTVRPGQYRVGMTRRGLGAWARWVLLCALAVAVVAMHHVGMVWADQSMTTGQPAVMALQQGMAAPIAARGDQGQRDSGMNHDMVHLCLAVMGAAVALVVTAWLFRVVRSEAFPLVGRVRGRSRARPPPLRLGRDILLTSCVLRV